MTKFNWDCWAEGGTTPPTTSSPTTSAPTTAEPEILPCVAPRIESVFMVSTLNIEVYMVKG